MVGSCGATPPASNRMTRSGACRRCASIAAAHGTPVPTATVRPFSRLRAAQQIISSIALYCMGSPELEQAVGVVHEDGLGQFHGAVLGQVAGADEVLGEDPGQDAAVHV